MKACKEYHSNLASGANLKRGNFLLTRLNEASTGHREELDVTDQLFTGHTPIHKYILDKIPI